MRFKMTVDMDNSAFEGEAFELKNIMRQAINKIESGQDCGKVMDSNGNTVGKWEIN